MTALVWTLRLIITEIKVSRYGIKYQPSEEIALTFYLIKVLRYYCNDRCYYYYYFGEFLKENKSCSSYNSCYKNIASAEIRS